LDAVGDERTRPEGAGQLGHALQGGLVAVVGLDDVDELQAQVAGVADREGSGPGAVDRGRAGPMVDEARPW